MKYLLVGGLLSCDRASSPAIHSQEETNNAQASWGTEHSCVLPPLGKCLSSFERFADSRRKHATWSQVSEVSRCPGVRAPGACAWNPAACSYGKRVCSNSPAEHIHKLPCDRRLRCGG